MKEGVRYPSMPYEEYRSRIERAKQYLAKHQMDAMVLFAPVNWYYYGGFSDPAQMHNWVWRSVLIVCQDRDPVAVIDANLLQLLTYTSWVEEVRVHTGGTYPALMQFRSHESFYPLAVNTLKDLGVANKTIGVETGADIDTYLSLDEFPRLKELLPDAKIVSADPAIWAQRMIKTPYEQEIIREGCRRACMCVRAAFETIRPGVNERDVHKAFWHKAVELDMVESPCHATWLCFSSNPEETMGGHRWITGPVDRVIKKGDFGHSDCGPTYKMYELDFQRAFHVGPASDKFMYYYNLGRDAFLETVDAMKPGLPICDLWNISIEALKKRNFPHGHSIIFIGHQEGLSNHEPPWLIAEEKTELQPGMVIAVEVGAFDQELKHFGTMPEDVILVTETGTENLTAHLSHDCFIAPV